MLETATEHANKQVDRKLGDEWTDWKGDTDPREGDIDEKPSTFLSLASAVLIISIAAVFLGWFMVKPRFEQLNPFLANLTGWMVGGFTIGFLISMLAESIVLKFGKSLYPYTWIEKFLLSLLPKTICLGTKLGISKDRIGNSFIKMHNFITKTFIDKLSIFRILILLPRCLKKEARTRLTTRLSGDNFKVYTAAGGEEAREAIKQYRPTIILAIACERDLISGIKDVAEKIPVFAIPNKRPEGPCKNTDFSLIELEEALRLLTAVKHTS
jgi:uncharacterized protein